MTSPPTDFSERTLSHLNEYIKFADQKASILLSGQLTFLGLFANLLIGTWSDSVCAFQVLSTITVALSLISAILAALVIYPQTSSSGSNLFFWENIRHYSEDKYEDKIKSLDEEGVLDQFVEENYELANIASSKYTRLKQALIVTFISISFAIWSVSILV